MLPVVFQSGEVDWSDPINQTSNLNLDLAFWVLGVEERGDQLRYHGLDRLYEWERTTNAGDEWRGSDRPGGVLHFGDAQAASRLMAGNSILAAQANASVFCWIKTTATQTSGGRAIYCERAASGNDIWKLNSMDSTVSGQSNKVFFTHRDDAGTLTQITGTSTAINDGEWHHVGLTKKSTAIKLFVDGVEEGGGTLNGNDTLTNSGLEAWIGSDKASVNNGSVGPIDSIRGWRRTLDPSEVWEVYQDELESYRQSLNWLSFPLMNRGPVEDSGSLVSGSGKTPGTTLEVNTGKAIATGQLAVFAITSDNESASDGDNNEHLSVTIDGNSMTQALEYTNSEGSSDAGCTTSIWYWKATTDVASAVLVITTLSQGKTAKAATGRVFDIPDGYTVSVDGTQTGETTNADPESLTATGSNAGTHIWVRATGMEVPVENVTLTPTSGWTGMTVAGTTGNPAASNQTIIAEFKIAEGTGSGASDPASGTTGDTASVLVGLLISPPSEGGSIPIFSHHYRQMAAAG